MTPENHLSQLIVAGATLTLTGGNGPTGPHFLAAAELRPGGLAWVALWPRDEFDRHVTAAGAAEVEGPYLNLYDAAAGSLVGTIAPMEPEERQAAAWDAWDAGRGDAPALKIFAAEILNET